MSGSYSVVSPSFILSLSLSLAVYLSPSVDISSRQIACNQAQIISVTLASGPVRHSICAPPPFSLLLLLSSSLFSFTSLFLPHSIAQYCLFDSQPNHLCTKRALLALAAKRPKANRRRRLQQREREKERKRVSNKPVSIFDNVF